MFLGFRVCIKQICGITHQSVVLCQKPTWEEKSKTNSNESETLNAKIKQLKKPEVWTM